MTPLEMRDLWQVIQALKSWKETEYLNNKTDKESI